MWPVPPDMENLQPWWIHWRLFGFLTDVIMGMSATAASNAAQERGKQVTNTKPCCSRAVTPLVTGGSSNLRQSQCMFQLPSAETFWEGTIKMHFLFKIGAVLFQDSGQLTACTLTQCKRRAHRMVCSFIYLSNVSTWLKYKINKSTVLLAIITC